MASVARGAIFLFGSAFSSLRSLLPLLCTIFLLLIVTMEACTKELMSAMNGMCAECKAPRTYNHDIDEHSVRHFNAHRHESIGYVPFRVPERC
jgi:hypothetical protein